jgi:hypothetical protein
LPHPLLEGGAANVEREIQADRRRLNEADNARDQRLIVAIGPMRCAFGKRSWRLRTSSSGSSPNRIEATPFLLEATRMAPREVCPTANLISSFVPPARYCDGVMPSMSVDFS